MKNIKYALFSLAIFVLFCQFFSSCTSSKMTQAEIAEYYKDLKITGKGTGSYSAKTQRIENLTQTQAVNQEIQNEPMDENFQEVIASADVLSTPTILAPTTGVNQEAVFSSEPTIAATPVIAESSDYISPSVKQAQEKMSRLATDASLTKKEKRMMKKEIRQTMVKELKAQKKIIKEAKKNGQETNDDGKIIRIILAFLIPPLSVAIGRGIDNTFWLNLVLTLLFFLPGVIHALIVVGEDY